MPLNLLYRLKRIFQGESGIVERAEALDILDEGARDFDGNLPQKIFIRNPLGELVEVKNLLILKRRDGYKGEFEDYLAYKQYKTGEKFP